MKAKLIVEGREFPIEIQDPELQKLLTPKKQTGYEYMGEGHSYSLVNNYGEVITIEHVDCDDDNRYKDGNYYSSCIVAQNNARADKLMRQLRRFAVEHRENEITWNTDDEKYYIYYDHELQDITWCLCHECQIFGSIYFNSENVVSLAIKTFHDELIWYFTKYKDSL